MDILIIFCHIMVFWIFRIIDTFLCSFKLFIKQFLCICEVLATVFMQSEDFLNFGKHFKIILLNCICKQVYELVKFVLLE